MATAPPFVRYVIVVHGIGDQSDNATILPVIQRFAEARRKPDLSNADVGEIFGDPLSLGIACGQEVGARWIEFDGIPTDPSDPVDEIFLNSLAVKQPGRNIRFDEVYWADLLHEDILRVDTPVKQWTASLIARLRNRTDPPTSPWVIKTLIELSETLVATQKVLNLRIPKLSKKVFTEFLGDVYLYGDYAATRGRAVRRFHQKLADIQAKHDAQYPDGATPARFTILAHSLGTILSFDALMFAHANDASRLAVERCDQADDAAFFTGYRTAAERDDGQGIDELPSVNWIDNVDGFVTLGSPIDKYLELWKPNYGYLQRTTWMARKRSPQDLIQHFNYSDEQDPVGHHIDLAYEPQQVAVHRVMGGVPPDNIEGVTHGPVEDQVFTRYATPGLAHVRYWQDGELFAHILDRAIDARSFPQSERRKAPAWFLPWRYAGALCWAYNVIPVLLFLAASMTLTTALPLFHPGPNPVTGATLETRVTALLAAVVSAYIGCRLVWLMVMWRQTLMQKERRTYDEASKHHDKVRTRWRAVARLFMRLYPILWGSLAMYFLALASTNTPSFLEAAWDLGLELVDPDVGWFRRWAILFLPLAFLISAWTWFAFDCAHLIWARVRARSKALEQSLTGTGRPRIHSQI